MIFLTCIRIHQKNLDSDTINQGPHHYCKRKSYVLPPEVAEPEVGNDELGQVAAEQQVLQLQVAVNHSLTILCVMLCVLSYHSQKT